MRRIIGRSLLLVAACALAAASCGGDGSALTTTTTILDPGSSTTVTTRPAPQTTTTSTTTTTTLPSGPPLVTEGDRNETVEAFQWLLNCNGYGDLTVDGVFGPATRTAVEAAQTSLGRAADGAPDEDTLADLSRACLQNRRLSDTAATTVVANAAPDDPEFFSIALLADSVVTTTLTPASAVTASLLNANGTAVEPQDDGTWRVETTADYLIEVDAATNPVTFRLEIAVAAGTPETGDWIISTNGVAYRGTKLSLGADAETVLEKVIDFLGHDVRSRYGEFDTGWTAITEPGNMGLRGVAIGGFSFLFFGPDPANPDRPETLARVRFEGAHPDADGADRPDDYVTTSEGITVGDTLADLKAAYGSGVKPGSNAEEHYYRFTDSGGELCFYFTTTDEPADSAKISEIATECRD
ncbi:MAG: peptidoglycan-binding protein [Actinobacteria bacterium]|nr:peptidoglycan-binding protein [Actinomycetota bacterium]